VVAVCGYVPALGAVDRRDLGAGGLVGHLDLCGARDCIEAKCASSECWVCLETSSLEVGIRSAWSGAVGGHTESEAEQQKPEAVAPVARAARTQRGARSTVAVTQRRRATQAMDVAVGPRLRSEILRIGIVAALVGGALAAIKLATDIGA